MSDGRETDVGTDSLSEWVTIIDAARRVNCTRQAVHKAIAEERLPARRLGRIWVIRKLDLSSWDQHRKQAHPKPFGLSERQIEMMVRLFRNDRSLARDYSYYITTARVLRNRELMAADGKLTTDGERMASQLIDLLNG